MPVSVTMPQLGESVTEGTVTRWLKAVGDTIAVDEPLLEISTDKVDTEIPSPVAGVLLSITAAEDAVVEIGGELAVIGDAGEVPTPNATAPSAPAESAPAPAAPAPAAIVYPSEPSEPITAAVLETPAPAASSPYHYYRIINSRINWWFCHWGVYFCNFWYGKIIL